MRPGHNDTRSVVVLLLILIESGDVGDVVELERIAHGGQTAYAFVHHVGVGLIHQHACREERDTHIHMTDTRVHDRHTYT